MIAYKLDSKLEYGFKFYSSITYIYRSSSPGVNSCFLRRRGTDSDRNSDPCHSRHAVTVTVTASKSDSDCQGGIAVQMAGHGPGLSYGRQDDVPAPPLRENCTKKNGYAQIER